MAAKTFVLAALLSLLFLLPALGSPKGRHKSVAIIREINKNGPYLGLITVYSAEEDAFFATGAFKNDSRYPYLDLSGRRFRVGRIEGKKVIYLRCGIGMVNAAAATQQMLDLFHISGLIHFGVSGNTNSSLSIGDVVVPKEFINTGIWDWMKPNATVPIEDIAKLDVESYNEPKKGNNSLGRIAYRSERFYSEAGQPNTPEEKVWFQVTTSWLHLATSLQGIEFERCVNSSLCLQTTPKLVVGLRGSTANIFLDNGAYRDFLFQTFGVSSADMESSAVVMNVMNEEEMELFAVAKENLVFTFNHMFRTANRVAHHLAVFASRLTDSTSFSNGYPVIVIRGLSDLAGGQNGENDIDLFQSLASSNVAKAVIQFIKLLSIKPTSS